MIIITGATGMLGAHILLKLCQTQPEVTALKRKESSTKYLEKIFSFYSDDPAALLKKIVWKDCDITDMVCLNDIISEGDTIIHAAAMVSFNKKDKKKIHETNVSGTENLVNLCLEKKVRKLCHISSVAALSKQSMGKNTNEELGDLNKNASEYSKSKYYSEMIVWRAITEGLNAVIVNPSVIIGPGNPDKGSGSLFKTAYKGNIFYTDGITGFVDVNDTADTIIRLTHSSISGERFVINAENISYKQLFFTLAKYLHKKPPKIKAGKALLKTASALEHLYSFPLPRQAKLSRELINAATSETFYSNEKICNTLNIRFTSPEQSIQKYAPFYLKELMLH